MCETIRIIFCGLFFVKISSGHETLADFHENLHFCYCVPYYRWYWQL